MEKPRLLTDMGFFKLNPQNRKEYHYGLYECPFCKKVFIAIMPSVKFGNTRSCGCYQVKRAREANITHGLCGTSILSVWNSMTQRCYNPHEISYKNYGGRGIRVCEEWLDVSVFAKWAYENDYKKELQIDRINNDGNYEPGNCRFVTGVVNTQNSRLITASNTSGYKGVHYRKDYKTWVSFVTHEKVRYHLGTFSTPEQAAIVRNNWIIEHHTFHPLNIIPHP